MIIGHDNLVKLFPDFKDDIQENGIDLRINELYTIRDGNHYIGCVDDTKYLPKLMMIESENGKYELLSGTYYQATTKGTMSIPDGYCQLYFLRSTLARCGLILTDAVGDNGFTGTLRVGLYNAAPHKVYIGEDERIIQAVTIKNDGTAKEYDGDYQDDKLYYCDK